MPAGDPRRSHHELLNHLAVISTNAYLLRDSALDADQDEIAADIVGSVEMAHALAVQLGDVLELHPLPTEVPSDREGAV